MIERIRKRDVISLREFFASHPDTDFYITENNERKFFKDSTNFKKLLECPCYSSTDKMGDIDGIVLLWKSCGNNITRYYLKITAKSDYVGQRLLKVVLWNFGPYELYAKINKRNSLLSALKIHGFKFVGDRGKEVLLKKDKFIKVKTELQKPHDPTTRD